MLCIVYKCSVFVYMNKLACIFSRRSYSLVVLVINFCIVEPFNFTLYTKRTYMCDTCGLITANSTCPFGTSSWSQLYMCPAVDHVSSNGGHCAQDGYGRMPQTVALDPALLMYIRYVCTHGRGYVLSECTDRSMCVAICSHSLVCKE